MPQPQDQTAKGDHVRCSGQRDFQEFAGQRQKAASEGTPIPRRKTSFQRTAGVNRALSTTANPLEEVAY